MTYAVSLSAPTGAALSYWNLYYAGSGWGGQPDVRGSPQSRHSNQRLTVATSAAWWLWIYPASQEPYIWLATMETKPVCWLKG
jgi:hypothetical protein